VLNYFPQAEKKGATASQYGLVFGVFELAMFIAAPIYGKYVSVDEFRIARPQRIFLSYKRGY